MQDVDHLTEFGFKRDMTRSYELGKLIGSGTFGSVYEGKERATGKAVAIKTIHKKFTGEFLEYHFVNRVQHEVDIYQHMGNSLNVVHLWDVYEDDTCVDLIMEHCRGGELWQRIRSGNYDENDAARIVREILRTISQFHANGVVMRDVKPENFLFTSSDKDAHLKAIDFGIAQYCKADETLRDRAGTPIYVAPEVLKMEYSQKADLWSAGILAYQLLTGRLPFVGDNGLLVSKLFMAKQLFTNKDVFRAILYSDLDFSRDPWPQVSPEGVALVQALLTRAPDKRPTAAEALHHPWFVNLDEAEAAGSVDEADAVEPLGATVVQRLQRFGTYGRLKQVALREIANVALTVAGDSEMVAEIEALFKSMDENGDGHVPYSAMVHMLKTGDFDLSETEVEVLISQMDVTEKGYIRYEEWLAAMLEWRPLQESAEWDAWVEQAFAAFDSDGRGKVGAAELAEMLCKDGVCAMPDVISAALREADGDGDALLSLEDFVRVVQMNKADHLSNFDRRHR